MSRTQPPQPRTDARRPASHLPRGRPRTLLSDARWRSIGRALGLSPREFEVAQCVFDGEAEAAMAAELGISVHTVHTHVERLYRKIGASSRCELVVTIFSAYVAQERR